MDSLDRLVTEYASEHHCASVAWGIVRDGHLAEHGGFIHPETTRFASGTPTATTRYRIASMTKSFSAAATLALRDDGVLRLDDDLAQWAPELADVRGPTTDAAPIRVRDLLTMTSGLVTDDPWADRHLDLSADEFDRLVAAPMAFAVPTGTAYEYSNFGFALLGRVVERAARASIQSVVTDRLLKPLGLTSTGWNRPADDAPVAPPVRWYDDIGFAAESPPLPDGMIAPMGGLWSTISDIATWVAFLDDAFPARDGTDHPVLVRSSRREMQTPHVFAGRGRLAGLDHSMSYGMGLRILDEDIDGGGTRRVVNHSGGFPGYGSNMRWLPGQRIGVIAFANTTYAPMSELTARLLNAVAPPHSSARRLLEATDRHELRAVAGRFGAWCQGTDDDELFADNVEPDLDLVRRRGTLDALALGEVINIELIDGGSFAVTFENHTITATVAPPRPYRVQTYRVVTRRSAT